MAHSHLTRVFGDFYDLALPFFSIPLHHHIFLNTLHSHFAKNIAYIFIILCNVSAILLYSEIPFLLCMCVCTCVHACIHMHVNILLILLILKNSFKCYCLSVVFHDQSHLKWNLVHLLVVPITASLISLFYFFWYYNYSCVSIPSLSHSFTCQQVSIKHMLYILCTLVVARDIKWNKINQIPAL